MKKIIARITKLKEQFEGKKIKKVFLKIYLLGLGLGLILYLAYTFGPFMVTCSTLTNTDFCTPSGIYIVLVLSFPGYLLVGKLFSLLPQIPWGISFLVVMLISGLIYYLLGSFIYKLKSGELKKYSRGKLVLFAASILLIVALMMLV